SLTDSTGFEDSPLPPGTYLMRWAVIDIHVTDFSKASGKIFQVGEKQVHIDTAGFLADTLTLESAHIKALGNTNSILLEIENLAPKPNLARTTYRETLVLSNSNEGSTLE